MPSDPDAMGLKPCPFCGGPAEIESIDNERWSAGCCDRNEEFCMGYQSLTSFARRSDAIAAWNRRAPMGGVSLDREGIARIVEAAIAEAIFLPWETARDNAADAILRLGGQEG